jgi:hypothetical protein
LKWYDGGGENGITLKRIFEVEVSFSLQNVNFPIYLKRLLELLFFFAPSLEDLGVLMIYEEQITPSKTSFQMALIYWWYTHILEWSYAHKHGKTMIMEMAELWIYWQWTPIFMGEASN